MLRTIAICVLLAADPCWAGVSVRGTANQATVYAHVHNGTTWLHVAMAQTASGSGVYTVADATIDNTLTVDCRTVAGLESGFPVVCNNSATDQTAVFLDGPREGVLDWDGSSERLPASVDELESGPDTRDLSTPDVVLKLPRRDSLRAFVTCYILPGETIKFGFDCQDSFVLPPGAVLATMAEPTGLTGDLSAERLGHGGRYANFEVAAESDAVEGSEQWLTVVVTNDRGGVFLLRAKVIVLALTDD